jgi:NAD-dependent deacetylase
VLREFGDHRRRMSRGCGRQISPIPAARRRLGAPRGFCHTGGMTSDSEATALARLIHDARRAVVFTGAGISTESGIPDFRSPGGIWTQMAPIYFDDFLNSEEARRETWRRRFAMQDTFGTAEPNRGHRAVDALIRRGKVSAVITQNIDGLHQASGIPSDKVIELHGNTTYATCLDCGTRHELADIRSLFERDGAAPRCLRCRGFVKTATISFGQAMPQDAMRRAHEETLAADLFIMLGSSLVVYPAAGFPELAKRNGANLAIVNREPTGLDPLADLVVHQSIGDTLGAAVGVN